MPNPTLQHPSRIPTPSFPEQRRIFLPAFTLLCAAFVPVLLFLGLYVSICPVSGLIATNGFRFNRVGIAVLIHILIYLGTFTATGYVFHGIAMKIRRRPALRHALLILFLLLPIATSFARVLSYGSIQGRGGTYTFWEAIDRYYEKKQLRSIR